MEPKSRATWYPPPPSLRGRLDRTSDVLAKARKPAGGKAAVAAALHARPTATNRWLGENLNLGGLPKESRQVGAWLRQPAPALPKKPGRATNYQACPAMRPLVDIKS